jgi:protein-tyrosine phosphatase
VLQLSGVWNLRDVGGVTMTDGATLRSGRFLRSGQLSALDDAGQRMLTDLGVGDVADLRSRHEIEKYGHDRVPNRVVVHNLPFPDTDGASGEAPHEYAFERIVGEGVSSDELPAAAMRFMSQEYARFATLGGARRAVGRLISLLADGRPVIAHCFAGKDRTGFVVAVVLAAVGVEWDAILADYLRSNDAVPHLRETMLAMLSQRDDMSSEATELARTRLTDNFLGVRPEYLNSARDSITQNYGSLEGYLRASGVEQAHVDALRAALFT